MAQQEATGHCKSCDKQVMVRRKGTNHILHFIVSIFTAFLWVPVWILMTIKVGGWRCSQCGVKTSRSLMK